MRELIVSFEFAMSYLPAWARKVGSIFNYRNLADSSNENPFALTPSPPPLIQTLPQSIGIAIASMATGGSNVIPPIATTSNANTSASTAASTAASTSDSALATDLPSSNSVNAIANVNGSGSDTSLVPRKRKATDGLLDDSNEAGSGKRHRTESHSGNNTTVIDQLL